jgi:hypothetical protein
MRPVGPPARRRFRAPPMPSSDSAQPRTTSPSGKWSVVPRIALASALLLVAGPSFAQATTLDCEAKFFSRSWSDAGQEDEEGSRGTWRITVDPAAGTVRLDYSSIFVTNGSTDTLNGSAHDVRVTENDLSFCLIAEGCGVTLVDRSGGTYNVDRSTLDRRRSTFHIRVRNSLSSGSYREDTQFWALHAGRGAAVLRMSGEAGTTPRPGTVNPELTPAPERVL